MGSLRNVVKRRTYKERGQLQSRKRLGFLEKHKDYVQRARDYHRKQDTIKKMQQKAYFRNPDEFYYGMIRSKTKKGVHESDRNTKFTNEEVLLMATQNKQYVAHAKEVERRKLEKLKEGAAAIHKEPVVTRQHVVFVEDDQEVRKFDAAKHFNTLPEYVDKAYNRPTVDMIATGAVSAAQDSPKDTKKKKKKRTDREIAMRTLRYEKLAAIDRELEIRKQLATKEQKVKVGHDKRGLPIYKWKPERKR